LFSGVNEKKLSRIKDWANTVKKDAENYIKKCKQANPRNKDRVNFRNKGSANSGTWTGQTPRKRIKQRGQTLETTTRQTLI
jgi:hypothetical protein